MSRTTGDPVVTLEDVEVHFESSNGLFKDKTVVEAVDGVSLEIPENDVVALVGESGCGKTTLGKTAIGLQRPTGGSVKYRDQDIWDARDATGEVNISYEKIRRSLQLIHQDPGSSLNPNRTVLALLSTPLKKYRPDMGPQKREKTIHRLLERLGVVPVEDYANRFPHQLSGGEQQRVALGRALLLQPDLILADEAVSALDVSLRVEMMDMMLELQEMFGTSYLFISHDFANARYLAKKADGRIGVMYLGKLVEIGPANELLRNPQHPYTRALVWSTPTLDPRKAEARVHEEPPVRSIDIPDPEDPPSGCNFHTRCPKVIPPDDIEIDQETFNDIMDFRIALDDGDLNTEQVWEDLGVDPETAVEEKRPGTKEKFVTEFRERYFGPHLEDPHRTRIDSALEQIATGERDAAGEELREHYESVCERVEPTLQTENPVACHLYGEPEKDRARAQQTTN